ncbi:VOC family protein [Streptomyces sp. NBC_01808]|uniref:VOC family protein n=1 Tax=Streptomyces sp. NBC_01808 TaxID=2975947 RepID=UPI002DD8173C|nr:VOC family protein [Streptomyces sp. NBC_01808]WSA42076.1 VOC family protein [Streptomyces sp. NBC_01808]
MPVATFSLVALDCPDPEALAGFYAGLLGGEVQKYNDIWCDLRTPDGIRIGFQRAPGLRPPSWPRADDNAQQLHLDLTVSDMEAAQERALALGARPLDLDDDGGERNFRVYADPAGHPFCLCRT